MTTQPKSPEGNWLISHLGHLLVVVGLLGILAVIVTALATRH